LRAKVFPAVRFTLGSRFVREPLILLFAYLPYYLARHAAIDEDAAFANARDLMRVEDNIGIFKEISVQSAAISYEFLVHVFNVIYFYGHWPLIVGGGVYLFLRHPKIYAITRNAFLLSGSVALVFFALFPVAPPRLSLEGIVDTLAVTVPISYDSSPLVNPYAALPSMHVGWALLLGLAFFMGTRHRLARLAALLLPPSMLAATVVTGNHFFIDGIAGCVLAIAAFIAAFWLHDRWPAILQTVSGRLRAALVALPVGPGGR
jgi:membrane-associated phospholipid phosphatase